MKYIKTKKYKKNNKLLLVILSIIILDIIILNSYIKKLSNSTTYLSRLKVEELTKYYLNETIKEYTNINTNDYIKINLVNNNIVNVDIDNNNSNILLKKFLNSLNNNTKKIEHGEISNYYNLEILKKDSNKGIIILMPIGVIFNNAMFASIGPKIPVKLSFLENINAYINVEVKNYGINNSLIKLYLNIEINEIMEMPFKNNKKLIKYKYLISSKLINGNVPSLYYSGLNHISPIVNSNVN